MPNNFPSIAQVLGQRVKEAIDQMRINLETKDERGFNSIASNVLNQSIDFNTTIFGTKVEVNIVMENYWKNVDRGQKPGTRVSIPKIMTWMAHKGIKAKTSIRQKKVGLKNRSFKKAILISNQEQLAKRIVEKIYRVGTKPTYFASDVINDEWQTRVAEQLRAVGAKDIRFTLNVPKETRI